MRSSRGVLTFCLLILFASVGRSQFRLSAAYSFEYGGLLSFDRTAGKLNHTGITLGANGESRSHAFGLEATWPFVGAAGLRASAQYVLENGELYSDPFPSGALLAHYAFASSTQSIRFAILPTVSVSELEIGFGPWLKLRSRGSWSEDLAIDTPASATFVNGARQVALASGDTMAASASQIGIDLTLGLTIPVGSFEIMPRLIGSLNLTQLSTAGIATAMSGGLSLAIPLFRSQSQLDSTAALELSSPIATPPPVPRVRFLVNGQPSSTAVKLERTQVRVKQYTQLIPKFTSEAQLAWLTKKEAIAFSYDSLANQSLDRIQVQTLNIIGYRLSHSPHASVTISSAALGKHIAEYLKSVWDVSTARIALSSANGTAVGDTVTISASDPNITAPLVTQWVRQSFSVPAVELQLTNASPAQIILRYRDAMSVLDAPDTRLDTTIELRSNRNWTALLNSIAIAEPNRIVATLGPVADTILIAPIDTATNSGREVKEYLFAVSNRSDQTESELEARSLLLSKVRELMHGQAYTLSVTAQHGTQWSTMSESVLQEMINEDASQPPTERKLHLPHDLGDMMEITIEE